MADETPKPGAMLQQIIMADSKVAGDIKRVLGVFNPRAVGMTERLMMRLDPDVAFGLAILRSPLINRQWSVDGDPEIAAFVDRALRPRYRQLALGASNAIAFGFQVQEKVFQVGPVKVETADQKTRETKTASFPNALTYKRFKAIDPRTISFLVEDDEVAGVEQTQVNGKALSKAPRVGMEKVVHWPFHSEYVFGDPRGFAVLDQAYQPWYDKAASNLLCNRYFERTADPPVKARGLATVKSGGREIDGGRFMLDQIAGLRSGGGIWLPAEFVKGTDKWAWDAEFLLADQRGQMFDGRLVALSIQILRALWITDKAATAGDGTGSLAQAQEHGGRLDETLESIVTEWLEILNEQVVKPLVLYNFGEEAAENAGVVVRMAGLTATKAAVYKDIMAQIIAAEMTMAQGETPRFIDLADMAAMAEELGVPLRPLSEVKELLDGRKEDAEAAAASAMEIQQGGEISEDDERKAGDEFKRKGIEE